MVCLAESGEQGAKKGRAEEGEKGGRLKVI
jgi:hypothetical protein